MYFNVSDLSHGLLYFREESVQAGNPIRVDTEETQSKTKVKLKLFVTGFRTLYNTKSTDTNRHSRTLFV